MILLHLLHHVTFLVESQSLDWKLAIRYGFTLISSDEQFPSSHLIHKEKVLYIHFYVTSQGEQENRNNNIFNMTSYWPIINRIYVICLVVHSMWHYFNFLVVLGLYILCIHLKQNRRRFIQMICNRTQFWTEMRKHRAKSTVTNVYVWLNKWVLSRKLVFMMVKSWTATMEINSP